MALDPVTAGIGLVDTFINKFVGDKDLAAKLMAEARSQEFSGELSLLMGQMKINKVEAAHKSIFVAGARPAILWICGIGLGYNTIVHPILDIWLEMPVVDPTLLMPVLTGILGLGGMRSFEKYKGVSREK